MAENYLFNVCYCVVLSSGKRKRGFWDSLAHRTKSFACLGQNPMVVPTKVDNVAEILLSSTVCTLGIVIVKRDKQIWLLKRVSEE